MFVRHFIFAFLLLTALCVASVASGAEPAVDADSGQPDRAQAAMDRALQHYRDGKLNEAAGLLRGFLVSHADSDLVDEARRSLAAIHADMDDPQRALEYLAEVKPSAYEPADQLMEGRLKLRLGAVDEALSVLTTLPAESLSREDRQARALLLAAGHAERERPQQALYFLSRALLTEGPITADEVMARMHVLMDAQMSADELDEATFMYHDSPIALLARLKLAWHAVAEGRKELARQRVGQVLAGPVSFPYREEALTLLSQLTDSGQLQRAVGVLLPLSGRYAAFGKLVQQGMEQARQEFRPAIPVRFLYHDTAGDADLAARQVAELAIGERVMAIIGPLVGNAAGAAAQRAGQEQVPLLALSQKEDLAEISPYVFRSSLTAQLQVETLLEHAMGDLGMTSFGILYPETRQGRMMAELFGSEVEKRGGRLVEQQGYLAEQTDFRRQIRLLQGLDPNAPDEDDDGAGGSGGRPDGAGKEPPFEALFVPDYADRISLVAPQLPFYGLENVQLLGTSGWNDAQLLQATGKSVEGAVFVDGFFRHSPYPFIQEFAEKYFATYGEEPTILAAQGYDAAGILLTLLNDPRINSRAALRWALTQMQIYPGVTGATRFDFRGEAVKTLFLLRVRDGAIVQIN